MRISTRGRYSLEALLCMSMLPQGECCSTREVASKTGIPERYLEQLFIPLRKVGVIVGIRGPQGGYYLKSAPQDITIGTVLRAVEGPLKPAECVVNGACPSENCCASRHTWCSLYTVIQNCIDSITIADLVDVYQAFDGGEYII